MIAIARHRAADGQRKHGFSQDSGSGPELPTLYSLGGSPYAATVSAESASLCQDVGFAKYAPPPVDVAGYTTALNDAVQAAVILHDGSGQPAAVAAAGPYISAGTTDIDAFLAAVGHPVGQ